MQETVEYSDYNQAFIKSLEGKVKSLEVTPMKKHVALTGLAHGKRVTFAALRSATTRKADVRLYGFMETGTSISSDSKPCLAKEGVNDTFLKGSLTPAQAAKEVAAHWKDVKGRVESYAKANGIKRGETPKRTWEARGIPFSYFQV